MTKDLLIISLMYVPGAFLALFLAIEVFVRNKADNKTRLASLLMFTHFLFFIGEYVRALLPLEYSHKLLYIWTGPAIVLAMCFGNHFHSMFLKPNERNRSYILNAAGYLPFLLVLFIIITDRTRYIFPSVEKVGPWNKFVPDPAGYSILIAAIAAYTLANTFILYKAFKKATTDKIKKRNRVLFIGSSVLSVWVVLFGIVFEVLGWNRGTPTFFFAFGTLLWMIAIRICMLKYDFLSTDERKYRIVFESSPLGILLMDRNAVVLEANAVAHRMFGVQGLNGLSVTGWLSDDTKEAFMDIYTSNFDRRKPYHNEEFDIHVKRGHTYILAVESEFIETEDGVIQFIMTRDVTELKRAEEQIVHMAYHDALTGLGNRRKLEQTFNELAGSASRSGPIGVLLLDLDRFKPINDALGHETGDQVLQATARLLTEIVDGQGMVARHGGDEFIVLLSGYANPTDAIAAGEQIVQRLSESMTIGERELRITTSAGICFYPQDGKDIHTLTKHADCAMYAAKLQGKNRLRRFDASMSSAALDMLTLESELWKALERNEIELYYQPLLQVAKQQALGVEALLRWKSPRYGLISPDRFIPIAEENGFIVKLGEWVLQEASRQCKRWMERGYEGSISVNVSSKQLMLANFAGCVLRILEESGLPSDRLCLEVTESTALLDVDHTREQLSLLTEQGVTIALDDFGKGFSSLSVLNELPFEQIKVDRSFIQHILDRPKNLATVKAIIQLAHSFGGVTVAEGIETPEQLELLKQLHCDYIQGYYFARPQPASEAERYLGLERK
ncbi:putative bifunctional diguanylate cyclase/phosphodiesterase [Paenibacillus soyae]|uniref:EAL domain-containing protein n=1 Tax=Paenibacillus soyae TaxID=2969249 RepID=A0A9X2MV20_9BACL|nr:EAL domain-containing protein [Paenibacillus soyae]MCR2806388.1 EAL domain-containing protein [Paenibacillus soyae]